MQTNFNTDARAWLTRNLEAGIGLRITPMAGATSSSVYLVDYDRGGAARSCVLRVLDNAAWLAEEPDLAAHEAAALIEAERAGLPAPRLIASAAEDVGFGGPVVLMTLIPGAVDLRPADFQGWLGELARGLAAIHRHKPAGFPWRFRSWVNRAALAPPPWSAAPHAWERAIQRVLDAPPDAGATFIHRDYHPANVLWRDGRISGVVDWVSACLGPAGADVAHCRTNLAQMYGIAAADRFLAAYSDAADSFAYDPYWDLDSLLDMCLPQPAFYPPWQRFGLPVMGREALNARIDAYLQSVVRRL